ncbi:MAG: hypothetical protein N2557_04200 [Hydrogenophilus sp.]|nr:hypothetical protein [Hydrogenophilus sp.]
MSESLRVAVVQMVSGMRVAENVARAEQWVEAAARGGADVVVLPEYWPLMTHERAARWSIAEVWGSGPLQEKMGEWARRWGVWVVGGTVPLIAEDEGRVCNSCLVFDRRGTVQARYDKMHLFRFFGERERYEEMEEVQAGSSPQAVEVDGWRIALAVCFDLRFPEYFRALVPFDGAVVVAAFTAITGRAHWHVLLQARAIENVAYVAASAQGGRHECGRETFGHSLVVDPWGEILGALTVGEGWTMAEWRRAELRRRREMLPALACRRLRVLEEH